VGVSPQNIFHTTCRETGVIKIPSAKSIQVVEIPLAAMAVAYSAAMIGWRRCAATNVPRRRPITAAL